MIPEGRIPTQPEVDCQFSADTDVVLHEKSVNRGAGFEIAGKDAISETAGQSEQEAGIIEAGVRRSDLVGVNRLEVPDRGAGIGLQIVGADQACFAAKFDGVPVAHPRCNIDERIAVLQLEKQRITRRSEGSEVGELEVWRAEFVVSIGQPEDAQ